MTDHSDTKRSRIENEEIAEIPTVVPELESSSNDLDSNLFQKLVIELENGVQTGIKQHKSTMSNLIQKHFLTDQQIRDLHTEHLTLIIKAFNHSISGIDVENSSHSNVQKVYKTKLAALKNGIESQLVFYLRKHEIFVENLSKKVKLCSSVAESFYEESIENALQGGEITSAKFAEFHLKFHEQAILTFQDQMAENELECTEEWLEALESTLIERYQEFSDQVPRSPSESKSSEPIFNFHQTPPNVGQDSGDESQEAALDHDPEPVTVNPVTPSDDVEDTQTTILNPSDKSVDIRPGVLETCIDEPETRMKEFSEPSSDSHQETSNDVVPSTGCIPDSDPLESLVGDMENLVNGPKQEDGLSTAVEHREPVSPNVVVQNVQETPVLENLTTTLVDDQEKSSSSEPVSLPAPDEAVRSSMVKPFERNTSAKSVQIAPDIPSTSKASQQQDIEPAREAIKQEDGLSTVVEHREPVSPNVVVQNVQKTPVLENLTTTPVDDQKESSSSEPVSLPAPDEEPKPSSSSMVPPSERNAIAKSVQIASDIPSTSKASQPQEIEPARKAIKAEEKTKAVSKAVKPKKPSRLAKFFHDLLNRLPRWGSKNRRRNA